ncbi:MAG: FAD binding domain-containing protein [Spirochaetia bacterium]
MPGKSGDLTVYRPENNGDLLKLASRHPDAVIWAGGTYLMLFQRERRLNLTGRVILIKGVEELKRINRTERYIDIGAAASIEEIITTGHSVLPYLLVDTLMRFPKSIRGTATMGGNICIPNRTMTLYPVLQLLDASLDIRKHGSSRWLSLGKLRDRERISDLEKGEIVNRIRIPYREWNYRDIKTFGSAYVHESNPLVFAGLARSSRGILDDFRFILASSKSGVYRHRELEAELVGQRIPLTKREIDVYISGTAENLTDKHIQFNNFQRDRGIRLLRQFLNEIGSEL